ncbi:MAG: NADH-quinone oxidoreductase subunit M, partial [Myxococcota bacterium]
MKMPILSMIVFLPLLGAVLLMAFPPQEKGLLRHTTMVFMTATFLISLGLLQYTGEYNPAQPFVGTAFPTMAFVERYGWIDALGASYLVGVDGISLWL